MSVISKLDCCRLAHLEDFFAQHADNVESHLRVVSQEIKQLSTWNKIEMAIPLSFGGKAVGLPRERSWKSDNASRA